MACNQDVVLWRAKATPESTDTHSEQTANASELPKLQVRCIVPLK